MRVANILTSLKCQKIGQQKYQSKRQVISTIPPKRYRARYCTQSTQSGQGLSRGTIPATPLYDSKIQFSSQMKKHQEGEIH